MQAAGAADKARSRQRPRRRREQSGFAKRASRRGGGLFSLAVALAAAPAHAVRAPAPPSRPWLDPALLPAAKAEGTLIVYSSTNEQEGLPLFRLFTRRPASRWNMSAPPTAVLMSRMAIEFRADQEILGPPAHRHHQQDAAGDAAPTRSRPRRRTSSRARDPSKRWYGVYANYNAPAYNTREGEGLRAAEELRGVRPAQGWAGKVAIDGTDNEWLKAMLQHYGEQKGTQIVKDIVAALAGGDRRSSGVGARHRRRRILGVANNYVNLSMNVLAGNPIEVWALDPVALFFGQVGVNSAPHPNAARLAANFMLSQECEQFLARRAAADPQGRGLEPARHRRHAHRQEGHHRADDTGQDRKWQRQFDQLFRGR